MRTLSDLRRFLNALSPAAIAAALSLAGAAPAVAETYIYDAVGRLTSVSYDNGGSIHYTYDANGNLVAIVTDVSITAVEGEAVPSFQFALGRATPNPGSGARSISFSIPSRGPVTLRVFDVAGRSVATLVDDLYDPGRYVARFSSDGWAGGVYFYRLTFEGRTHSGRMVLLK